MPEGPEIETTELQETIEELHEERREREEAERRNAWTRYIALTTAILAVFAAVGALQSGKLVNHALVLQLKASDTWSEYQADRQKQHLYSTQAFALLDAGVAPPPESAHHAEAATEGTPVSEPVSGGGPKKSSQGTKGEHAEGEAHGTKKEGRGSAGKKLPEGVWKRATPSERLSQYIAQWSYEDEKTRKKSEDAKELEKESEEMFHLHHQFAESVALIQVAIALSAVAALTRIKSVWAVGLAAGGIGIYFFVMGFVH